jgi:hypothetical protein
MAPKVAPNRNICSNFCEQHFRLGEHGLHCIIFKIGRIPIALVDALNQLTQDRAQPVVAHNSTALSANNAAI